MWQRTQSYTHFHISKLIVVVFLSFVYLLMLFIFSGLSNLIVIIMLLELFSWIFTFFIKAHAFKYLIVQRWVFFFIITFLLIKSKIVILPILIKIGLPPFHQWVILISFFLRKLSLAFFLSVHKVFPLFFLRKLIFWRNLLVIVYIIIIGIIIMVSSLALILVFLSSSWLHSGWILIAGLQNAKLIMVYMVIYLSIFAMLLFLLSKMILYSLVFQNSLSNFLLLVISGLPPFSIFCFKLFVITFIAELVTRVTLLFLVSSVFRLFTYYRIFHVSLRSSLLAQNSVIIIFSFIVFIIWI